MDPLSLLIDRVRDILPDADVRRGSPLTTGTPTVEARRTPDQAGCFTVTFYDTLPLSRYQTLYGMADLHSATLQVVRYLKGLDQ